MTITFLPFFTLFPLPFLFPARGVIIGFIPEHLQQGFVILLGFPVIFSSKLFPSRFFIFYTCYPTSSVLLRQIRTSTFAVVFSRTKRKWVLKSVLCKLNSLWISWFLSQNTKKFSFEKRFGFTFYNLCDKVNARCIDGFMRGGNKVAKVLHLSDFTWNNNKFNYNNNIYISPGKSLASSPLATLLSKEAI